MVDSIENMGTGGVYPVSQDEDIKAKIVQQMEIAIPLARTKLEELHRKVIEAARREDLVPDLREYGGRLMDAYEAYSKSAETALAQPTEDNLKTHDELLKKLREIIEMPESVKTEAPPASPLSSPMTVFGQSKMEAPAKQRSTDPQLRQLIDEHKAMIEKGSDVDNVLKELEGRIMPKEMAELHNLEMKFNRAIMFFTQIIMIAPRDPHEQIKALQRNLADSKQYYNEFMAIAETLKKSLST